MEPGHRGGPGSAGALSGASGVPAGRDDVGIAEVENADQPPAHDPGPERSPARREVVVVDLTIVELAERPAAFPSRMAWPASRRLSSMNWSRGKQYSEDCTTKDAAELAGIVTPRRDSPRPARKPGQARSGRPRSGPGTIAGSCPASMQPPSIQSPSPRITAWPSPKSLGQTLTTTKWGRNRSPYSRSE